MKSKKSIAKYNLKDKTNIKKIKILDCNVIYLFIFSFFYHKKIILQIWILQSFFFHCNIIEFGIVNINEEIECNIVANILLTSKGYKKEKSTLIFDSIQKIIHKGDISKTETQDSKKKWCLFIKRSCLA